MLPTKGPILSPDILEDPIQITIVLSFIKVDSNSSVDIFEKYFLQILFQI